ncbi:hypothetical protein M409DRAFT_70186 [Zasmidium cellare ATCC 36951]|uniref:Major facilitator superfamily (MFS) profile domain-containing protein n=1 Tax=Zasmidium cellare ATCC 36951 TaxID=1080233 RepID=A0A6A6C1R3_ZASCE|nr:uncharacterized protein M409DRAFT_70186 [Zasmidium cellare ATCC 36951]KAF2160895.1 hypothetical protein M409DRAFT_70186 [Zasmidium cellare ATCC 36951]
MFFLKKLLLSRHGNEHLPQEVLNFRLVYGIVVYGFMGAVRGLDEGLIGTTTTLPSFSRQFKLEDPSLDADAQANRLSNITSMVQLGSIAGSLVAFFLTDRIGRVWAVRELVVIWMIGIAIYLAAAANGSLGMVIAGRFIAGIGIGQTTVVGPTYLAEIAPGAFRGLAVSVFAGMVYFGTMLAYFAAWGSSLHISDDSQLQWILPNLLHVYFAALIALGSFWSIESPRWLVKVGKVQKAGQNLAKIRDLSEDHEFVTAEMKDISDQLEREAEATKSTGFLARLKEFVVPAPNRYRLMLSVMTQLLSQWSGASSITIYAPRYFAMIGTSGTEGRLLATAVLGAVKLSTAIICAIFLIDWIGRKRSMLGGITIQSIALLYVALFLQISGSADKAGVSQSPSTKRAATGAVAMIYLSGVGWAAGWNTMQYLMSAETYPLQLRALGSSVAMAVPEMLIGLTNPGTMFFFAAVSAIGLLWVWFFVPELKGMSLESVDAVFELPWYVIGRRGPQLVHDLEDHETIERIAEAKGDAVTIEHSEKVKGTH